MSIKNFSAAISFIALLTSCVSYNNPDFGGFRTVEFTESDKMEIAIEKNYSAPTRDHPKMGKFTFRFHITEVNTRFSSITVNQMIAQYKDGYCAEVGTPLEYRSCLAHSPARQAAVVKCGIAILYA